MLSTVWARVTLPGFHAWPQAPEHRAYLRDRHRHLFHIQAHVRVGHDERQVEFHDLRQAILRWWGPGDRECAGSSCETLARDLIGWLTAQGNDVAAVSVSEDGEVGATITTTLGCPNHSMGT